MCVLVYMCVHKHICMYIHTHVCLYMLKNSENETKSSTIRSQSEVRLKKRCFLYNNDISLNKLKNIQMDNGI